MSLTASVKKKKGKKEEEEEEEEEEDEDDDEDDNKNLKMRLVSTNLQSSRPEKKSLEMINAERVRRQDLRETEG